MREKDSPHSLVSLDNVYLQYIIEGKDKDQVKVAKIEQIQEGTLVCPLSSNDIFSGIKSIQLAHNNMFIMDEPLSLEQWPNNLVYNIGTINVDANMATPTPEPAYAIMGIIKDSDGNYYNGLVNVVAGNSSDIVECNDDIFRHTFNEKPINTIKLICEGYKSHEFAPE